MASVRTRNVTAMHKAVYDKRSFRNLPREVCMVEELLGETAGPCVGLIHLHHTNPLDPDSRLVSVCAGHHPKVHALLNVLGQRAEWKRCHHRHPTREGREACERRLNRAA